jgi:hypothetical protein
MDSKIVASASYINIVVDVSVVFASSSLDNTVSATTTPTFVIPSAAVSWTYLVFSYELDTIGKNPVLRNVSTVQDQTLISSSKRSLDYFSSQNEGPGVGDPYAIDYFLSADYVVNGVPIKLFVKGLTDTPRPVDIKTYFLSKLLGDSITSQDSFNALVPTDDGEVMSFSKAVASDAVSKSDVETNSVNKRPVDNATTNDGTLTRSNGKVILDTVLKSETLVRLFGKPLSDSFTKSDVVANLISKPFSESKATSDSQVKGIGKGLADSAIQSELLVRGFNKPLADSFSKSDALLKAVSKPLADSSASSDNKVYAYSKSVSDSVHPSDAYQHIAVNDDDENMLFGKISQDTVSKADFSNILNSKALTDSTSQSDSGSIVKTDYWDINYTVITSGPYVGTSQTF